MAKTPRLPVKPTANNPADVQIDESNPYNEFDRGLFAVMQLEIEAGLFEDRICRIGSVSVESYQGDSAVAIFTYQVIVFSQVPTKPQDCIDYGAVYVDPRNGHSSFSFSTLARDYSALMTEALCIRDFLTYKRAQQPAEWEDIARRQRVFDFFAKLITSHHEQPLGVNNVQHKQYYTSIDNLPINLERAVIRYKGYELLSLDPLLPKEEWKKWAPNQFIEFASPMTSHRLLPQKALEHFIKHGHDEVKIHFQPNE